MMPNSVYLHIVYSNFLIEVRGSNQNGWSHLEEARKLEPNFSFQFSIFTREQEHKQKSSGMGGGGGEAVDLVSYVEFQRNFRCGPMAGHIHGRHAAQLARCMQSKTCLMPF